MVKSSLNKNIYRVGISGHRDLKSSDIPIYRANIIKILKELIIKHPDSVLCVITPLAEGADRLAAECAMTLGLDYEVILPMPSKLYIEDFKGSQKEFFDLCDHATSVEVLPLCQANTLESISQYGNKRNKQYLRVGREVVDRSDSMLFLWDGVDNGLTGGTADIKNYAEEKNKSLYYIQCQREKS